MQSLPVLEKIILDLESELGAAPINYDPDGPWAHLHARLFRSKTVTKHKCPTCGFMYTRYAFLQLFLMVFF